MNAAVIEIRIPRDDELVGEIADKAEAEGLMLAHNGRHIAVVPKLLPGWWPILRSQKEAA